MEYKHFSHHHKLNIYNKPQEDQKYPCHGCQLPCNNNESIYACWPCNFFLHEHCGNATRYSNHPSHPSHPLILSPSPTYCSGSFICNACGVLGTSFSYSCALCEVDLHLNCAFLPQLVTHKSHQHQLIISYSQKGCDEFCKICSKKLGKTNWSYVCSKDIESCDFSVHTFCATTEVKPGMYQGDDSEDFEASDSSNNRINHNGCEANSNQSQTVGGADQAGAELIQLQTQMQMAEQFAQMMASFNLSHLA